MIIFRCRIFKHTHRLLKPSVQRRCFRRRQKHHLQILLQIRQTVIQCVQISSIIKGKIQFRRNHDMRLFGSIYICEIKIYFFHTFLPVRSYCLLRIPPVQGGLDHCLLRIPPVQDGRIIVSCEFHLSKETMIRPSSSPEINTAAQNSYSDLPYRRSGRHRSR